MKLGKEKEGHFSTALSFFFVLHFFQESFGNSTSTLKSNSVFHRFLIVASWSFSHRQLFFFIVCWSLWWRSDSRFIVIVIKTWNLSPLPNSFSRKPKSSQLCQNGPPYFMYKNQHFLEKFSKFSDFSATAKIEKKHCSFLVKKLVYHLKNNFKIMFVLPNSFHVRIVQW